MDEDIIQDLKQFITTIISQQTAVLANKDDISNVDKKLSVKIDDLSNSVAEALESTNETAEDQLNDHNKRITKLEQKVSLNTT